MRVGGWKGGNKIIPTRFKIFVSLETSRKSAEKLLSLKRKLVK
jgi:hypothetical protein